MTLPHPGPDVPLDQPLYGASLPQATRRMLRKYATFTGRASRSEFWWAMLAVNLIVLVASVPLVVTLTGQLVSMLGYAAQASATPGTPPSMGFDVIGWMLGSMLATLPMVGASLALLVPTYAVGARRLHDAGLSGWFMALAPVSGGILTIVVGLLPPRLEGLRYEQPGVAPVLHPDLRMPQQAPGWGPEPFVAAPQHPVAWPPQQQQPPHDARG